MKMKHFFYLSTALAGVSLFSTTLTQVQADQVSSPQTSVTNNQNLIQNQKSQMTDQLNQQANQLTNLKEEVKGSDLENSINSALNSIESVKSNLNSTTSLDGINSMGIRVEALTEVIQAINFATSQLTNKVSQAHTDMGFAITKLVIAIANPFASVDDIKAKIAELKEVEKKVLSYPDLAPTDKATIYVRAKLAKAIWHTRAVRNEKITNIKSEAVTKALNEAISHAAGVRWNPSSTVGEVNQEIINLEKALDTALKS
ncbi:CAMP factor family pore-forming toxin [Streptococcus didelphis]|uniref:cAMP factor family pore-forming toxin n=1 Tax=Streptococcus didelphis TaxID=102886 RepID=A0ABY9LHB4_9STRE|nr:CAMP factor family pore-forming toxin [Streptococcus didelphis]WMB28227.1 CAMP factor family pore-forming toxin [Streptococcus didelphis]WMB28900.1 CAMP factor family pore-forming toxin [Streptococcus didelphis]